MKNLLFFGFIQEATDIHSLIEKLMKAERAVSGLRSVEQEYFLEKYHEIEAVFG